jgi:hypothetical protein
VSQSVSQLVILFVSSNVIRLYSPVSSFEQSNQLYYIIQDPIRILSTTIVACIV